MNRWTNVRRSDNIVNAYPIDRLLLAVILLLVAICLPADAATFYVAPDGQGDDNDTGSVPEQAWATADFAVTQVSSGDSIHFLPGIHTRATSLLIPVGVSLIGAGPGSVIAVTVSDSYSWGFVLSSPTVNTDGNQTISHLRFVGTGNNPSSTEQNITGAIRINLRGNVHIHDCEFEDFDDNAVTFSGQGDAGGEPTAWAVGNMFYDNTLINTCKEQLPGEWMSGGLQIGAQEDMEIFGNYFDETARGTGSCGYNIKYYANGWNRGLKIHDNTFLKLPGGPSWNDWNFAIELWNWMGGVEIYDNIIEGSIDVVQSVSGEYDFAVKIHDNTFGYDALPTSSGSWANLNAAVYLEHACVDVEIFNNLMRNLETPFRFSPLDGDTYEDIRIHHNVIHSIGNDTPGEDVGCNILNFAGPGSWTVRNLFFEHNSVYTDVGAAGWALIFPAQTFEHVYIRNNIIQGFDSTPIEFNGSNTDVLFIQNNNFYGNGSNLPNVTGAPTNYTSSGNITTAPGFSDAPAELTLRASSDNIDAGLDLGYETDVLGHPVPIGPGPDIGAYEYGAVIFSDGFEAGDTSLWSAGVP